MKIIKIEIDNFMSWRGNHIISFDHLGLVLLSGKNYDDPANNSNGSGKSTLLEAITWGLFGEGLPRKQGNAERGVNSDEVFNDVLKKQTKVEVTLYDERRSRSIVITRWRKYKEGTGRQTSGVRYNVGDMVEEALDQAQGDRRICEILGITWDIWCRSVVFGQESQFNFCEATSKERADILTQVTGLGLADIWLAHAREERTTAFQQLARVEGELSASLKGYQVLENDDSLPQLESWENMRQSRIAAAKNKLIEIEEAGKKKRALLEPEIEERKNYEIIFSDEQAIKAALQQLRMPEMPPEDQNLKQVIDNLQILNSQKISLESALRQIKSLDGAATCPTCFQPIRADLCSRFSADYQIQLEGVVNKIMELSKWRNELLRTSQELHNQVKQQYELNFNTILRNREEIQAKREALEYKLNNYYGQLKREIEADRQEWHRQSAIIKEIEVEENPFKDILKQRTEKLNKMKSYISDLEKNQTELVESIDILNWWDKEIPRFKTWIFDSVVDVLAAEANRWLQIMSAGVIWIKITTVKQLKNNLVKDDLDIQVFRLLPDGEVISRPYRLWSGGEKRRIGLAVDLGLSYLMATRASEPYQFLCFDEIDRHLDLQGREGLRAVLEKLKSERETCLVISHDQDFKASFDKILTVVKRAGISQVEKENADEEKVEKEKKGQVGGIAEGKNNPLVQAGEIVQPACKKNTRGRKRSSSVTGNDSSI